MKRWTPFPLRNGPLPTAPPARWAPWPTSLAANGWASGVVTRSGLDWLVDKLIKAGTADNLRFEGLKEDRKAVIGGGVSVLRAIFDLFGIEQMVPAQGALRQGALYDLIDRETDGGDVRERTVHWLAERFSDR